MGWRRRRTPGRQPGRHRAGLVALAPSAYLGTPANARVVLGFRDGSELTLDPGVPLVQALVHVAGQIVAG